VEIVKSRTTMGHVFHSGAFLQQCWSAHPLCVSVRRITSANQLALACTSCRFAHYVTLGSVVVGGPVEQEPSGQSSAGRADAHNQLVGCLDAHATALSLREMDVFGDRALIRCAECRRHYALRATAFETHQK
jgi:hypothetical protein